MKITSGQKKRKELIWLLETKNLFYEAYLHSSYFILYDSCLNGIFASVALLLGSIFKKFWTWVTIIILPVFKYEIRFEWLRNVLAGEVGKGSTQMSPLVNFVFSSIMWPPNFIQQLVSRCLCLDSLFDLDTWWSMVGLVTYWTTTGAFKLRVWSLVESLCNIFPIGLPWLLRALAQ